MVGNAIYQPASTYSCLFFSGGDRGGEGHGLDLERRGALL
jgi:hypothetical protein